MCFTCAWNIVLQHKVKFCVDVFHVFGCTLSVYHLSSHWVRVCLFWIYVVIEHIVKLKMLSNQHIVNTKKSWTHASTNLLAGWVITSTEKQWMRLLIHTLISVNLFEKCPWSFCPDRSNSGTMLTRSAPLRNEVALTCTTCLSTKSSKTNPPAVSPLGLIDIARFM